MEEDKDGLRYLRRIKRIRKTTAGWSRSKLEAAHATVMIDAMVLKQWKRILEKALGREKVLAALHEAQSIRFLTLTTMAAARISKAKAERVRGGKVAAAKRPAVAAKDAVRAAWEEWQQGKRRYKNSADFAKTIADAHPSITTSKTVENWARAWQKEARDKKKC